MMDTDFDPARPEWCHCCGRSLAGKRTVWLELCRTGRYSDPAKEGALPEALSQGLFAFGTSCAKRTLLQAEAA